MSSYDRIRQRLARPCSYLGSPIKMTEAARLNDSRAFFRVSVNLSLARRTTLVKFARYIRYGFLSMQDAQDLILGRLPRDKLRAYQLAKFWISYWDFPESFFLF